tara:strand:- start:223 stop:939 length:717 start_codon:yes stop_codon:yes gene_type:complete
LELVYSKELKIKNIENGSDILQMLNYLYVLLNVKKENQLNEMEESVLNGFILDNYKNFTLSEIKHAFRLACAGKLNIELYQKLDSITFGKVLLNYKTFKNNKIKEFTMKKKQPEKVITQDEINSIEQMFIDKCILPYVEERKTMEQPKCDWETYKIFDYFWKKKLITLNKTKINKYKKEAEKLWKLSLKFKRDQGERIGLDTLMGNRTSKMYASCIALYHNIDDIIDLEKLKEYNNAK